MHYKRFIIVNLIKQAVLFLKTACGNAKNLCHSAALPELFPGMLTLAAAAWCVFSYCAPLMQATDALHALNSAMQKQYKQLNYLVYKIAFSIS